MANIMGICYKCSAMIEQIEAPTKLASALTKRHLTQRRVAFLLDKPESTISNWSRGLIPRPDSQQAIVEVLNEAGALDNIEPVTVKDLWGAGV